MGVTLDRVHTKLEVGDVVTLPKLMKMMAEQNRQSYDPSDTTKWLYRGSVYTWKKDGTEYEVGIQFTDAFNIEITGISLTGRKRTSEEADLEAALLALIGLLS